MSTPGYAVGHLRDRILAIHHALDDTEVAHAFGGAIALIYYTEPRATNDVDINIFCTSEESGPVLDTMAALGITVGEDRRLLAERDGQVRLRWSSVLPIDLFFANMEFHKAIRSAVNVVSFSGTTIPIIAEEHLIACKAIFNRPKDWIDIDNMLRDAFSDLDVDEALKWVSLISDEDVVSRLHQALADHGFTNEADSAPTSPS
ncbi:MAG: hypothetical protein M1134_03615 [Actinobacteria bacterium]|jgi:hypothetical protein|nr:hypothetical protein [Actinomycetota bacterium]MCL5444805.1 hypothetical protein [Actinomycetota bacterium]